MAEAHLYEIADNYTQVVLLLQEDDIPEEALRDTLEAIEGEFEQKAVRVALMFRNWKAAEAAVDAEIERLQKRKKTFQNKQRWIVGYLRDQMARIGIKKVEDPVIRISRRAGSLSVDVENIEVLPNECVRVPTEVQPDKKVIGDVLKAIVEHRKITGDDTLSEQQKESQVEALLRAKPEWMHPYILSEEFPGARLHRGDDVISIA